MHVTQVHPVTAENQFHCTKLYITDKQKKITPKLTKEAVLKI